MNVKELVSCYCKLLKFIVTDEYCFGYSKNEDKINEIKAKIRQIKSK